MTTPQTPIQPSFLVDGPGGSPQIDPILVVDTPAVVAERAVLGSRAVGAVALSEVASRGTVDVDTGHRPVMGRSEAATARDTQATVSQLDDSRRGINQHRVFGRTGRKS